MSNQNRYPLSKISVYGISQFKQQNPYMVAWWSAVFPGFGHYLLNQYTRATLLTIFEVLTNTLSHLNEAMVYSFCGKFELAKAILEPRWAFGYLCIYLVAIGDSFRSAIYHNKLSHLAKLERTHFRCKREILPQRPAGKASLGETPQAFTPRRLPDRPRKSECLQRKSTFRFNRAYEINIIF